MKAVIYYTINDGLFIWNGSHGIMLDYLFDNSVPAWSDMPKVNHQKMMKHEGEFAKDHTLIFTHAHPDHYSPKYVKEYIDNYDARIWGMSIPESNLKGEELEPGIFRLEIPGYEILMFKAPHQGTGEQAEVDNSFMCIRSGNYWYIHSGDSIFDKTLLEKMKKYGVDNVEAAFVNLYQIVPNDQRRLIESMNAKQNFCIHFPFEKNDLYGLKKQFNHFVEKSPDPFLKTLKTPKPLSRVL